MGLFLPAWQDKEAHKIWCYFVSKLLKYEYEVNNKQEVLLALDSNIISRETKNTNCK